MIALTKIRELDLTAAPSPGRPLYLNAASGLVCAGPWLYVVADDELHLGVFRAGDAQPGHLIRLFPGELPAPKAERKARKPDLEALTRLPPSGAYPHGALFALGSGSTPERRMGVVLVLDAQHAVSGAPRAIDLTDMFTALDARFPALNIEGALVSGDELLLLQRGNKRTVENAIIRFHLPAMLAALGPEAGSALLAPFAIHPFVLGSVAGVPLSITDGTALPNGDIAFSAIAEDTEDNYNDGECVAAAVGIVDAQGNLRCLQQLAQPHKIEGIDARVDKGVIRLLLVTDADDANIPACLFSAVLG